MRHSFQIVRFTLVSIVLVAATACDRGQHQLRLVTPQSPVDRDIVMDLVELFDDDALVSISLTEQALSEAAAIDAVAAGDADVALVSNNLPFRGDVATVMPLYPTVLHIAWQAGSDASLSPEGLRGTVVYAGEEGSASRYNFERMAERIGLTDSDFRYSSGIEDTPDVVVVFAPISPERIAAFPQRLVLTGVGTPSDIGMGSAIDTATLLNPHFKVFVIPVGTYGEATPEPVVTIAVDKILVARDDLNSSVVYDLINDVLRLRPALAAKRPGLLEPLTEDFDASRSRFVLHAGTQAYLQRDAPTYMERYSGIAEVIVTLMVGLVSAAFAGVRILRFRRKNRIDRYYAATIDIRKALESFTSPTERLDAIANLRALQNEAFDLLVHEKLAADESFRIFITLSNDVLRQLGATGPDDHLSDH